MHLFAPITEIASLLATEQLTPTQLVEETLTQIHRVDPQLNAFITVDEAGIRKEAKKATTDIRATGMKSPLHGIPIGIKDNIAVKGLPMTLGSKMMADYIPQADATVVKRLKAAGALIIGKHNLDAFAYGITGETSDFGPTKNPHDDTVVPGGSSSGSAAAIAAGMSYAAIGSDTGGSLRIPASYCGIVAMKPTYGKFPMEGVFPLAPSLDHIGPMTRTVADNYILYEIMQGNQQPFPLQKLDLHGLSIGIPSAFYHPQMDQTIAAKIASMIALLSEHGAKIKEVDIPHFEEIYKAQHMILTKEAYELHREKLKQSRRQDWPAEVYERLNLGKYVRTTQKARKQQAGFKEAFLALYENVDVLFTPTVAVLPPKLQVNKNSLSKQRIYRPEMYTCVSPTNITGLPSLVMPLSAPPYFMPIGMQWIGAPHTERKLYEIGQTVEEIIAISD